MPARSCVRAGRGSGWRPPTQASRWGCLTREPTEQTALEGFQTLKLSPHEQLAFAFGFENLNPPETIALE